MEPIQLAFDLKLLAYLFLWPEALELGWPTQHEPIFAVILAKDIELHGVEAGVLRLLQILLAVSI